MPAVAPAATSCPGCLQWRRLPSLAPVAAFRGAFLSSLLFLPPARLSRLLRDLPAHHVRHTFCCFAGNLPSVARVVGFPVSLCRLPPRRIAPTCPHSMHSVHAGRFAPDVSASHPLPFVFPGCLHWRRLPLQAPPAALSGAFVFFCPLVVWTPRSDLPCQHARRTCGSLRSGRRGVHVRLDRGRAVSRTGTGGVSRGGRGD